MARQFASGMTLWEWLALIALLAGFGALLAVGARRAPMVDDARSLKNELEEIDRVIRVAEADGRKPESGVWSPEDYRPMVKEKFARLREKGQDPFGNAYPPVRVGERPTVAPKTIETLNGQLDPSFWSPFIKPVNPATTPANSGATPDAAVDKPASGQPEESSQGGAQPTEGQPSESP